MRISAAANSITVDRFESKSQLHPMNGAQLRSADQVPLVMTIRDRDRVDLGWQGGLPDRYHRLQTQMPSPEQMRAYAGEYWSGDAQARWSIAAESNGLAIKTAAGWHIPLEALGSDRFAVDPWSLRFMRDAAGRIASLNLHRRRLWNPAFEQPSVIGPHL